MKYHSVAEARDMPGLRLVLTEGMPGPWAEAAKSILNYKDIEFIPVSQTAGEANEDLRDWTGQTTAPVAVYNDEPVRYTWLDILMLAERLAPEKPLLPAELEQRALVVGLSREVAGEDGLGWNRRHYMLSPAMAMDEPPEGMLRMARKYGWSESALQRAAGRIGDILAYFAGRLEAGDYIVGDSVTAVDFYLANFMGIFRPLSPEMNPMPEFLRRIYSEPVPELEGFLSDALFKHRDMMYERYIDTPLEF